MTTIAWDGTILAADRGSWTAGTIFKMRKLAKVFICSESAGPATARFAGKQVLVARVGECSLSEAMLGWLANSKSEKPRYADFDKDGDPCHACLLVISPPGNGLRPGIHILTVGGNWTTQHEEIFTLGSGREIALGALCAGANAKRAIEIAIERTDYAAIGVDTISF